MEEAKQLHAHTLRHRVPYLQPLLLRVLATGDLRYAVRLLSSHPSPRSAPLHNRLLHALSASDLLLPFFSRMHRLRLLSPLSFTILFSSAACAAASGLCSHGLLLKSGHLAASADPFLASALLSFYAKNCLPSHARQVFDEMPRRDTAVYNALLSACAKSGLVDDAKKLFEEMPERNVVSWTAMISGLAQNGRHEEAVEAFLDMWERQGVQPNELTVSSVLPACGGVGAMELGTRIEEYARGEGFMGNVFVANALLEMYAKCGSVGQAWRVFDMMGPRRDLCSWNSMIMAFAVHGRWREALGMFFKLRMTGMRPDDITLVGVLQACTHGGLVAQGKHFFNSMEGEFGSRPRLEHYGCMVDLLGRAGHLRDAYSLITDMPMEPDAVIWGALLGACSFHGDVELAEVAAGELLRLEPRSTANRVILSNVHASTGNWTRVAGVWKMLRQRDHKKSAGYSFVELDGRMHKFLVEDTSHPRFEEIYETLDNVTVTMKGISSAPDLELQVEG